MEQTYAEQYRFLYQQHWWWRARERAILKQLDQLGLPRDGSLQLLDVGCGDGLLFDALQPFGTIRGVEGDEATLSPHGKWRERIHLGWFDQSYQPECSFDVILMLDFLEHLSDPAAALKHARNLLNPNGYLIMTVPAHPALWTKHDELNHHYLRYTKSSFQDLASRCQVKVLKMQYLFHWTCPVKLAIRAKESVVPSDPANPKVPNRIVNSAFYAACRFEQLTISRLGMPFGSSLLVVGQAT